jgi:hypothetical protein
MKKAKINTTKRGAMEGEGAGEGEEGVAEGSNQPEGRRDVIK